MKETPADRLAIARREAGYKKALMVADPERPSKKVPAYIVDPTFDPLEARDNPYESAVRERRRIRLTGRVTRHPDGRIKSFHAIAGALL